MMMGQQFSTKLYAFGLAKRSKYYNPVSWEILKLIEEGAIELLTHKWYAVNTGFQMNYIRSED